MATDHEKLRLWALVNRVGLRVGCGKTVRCHTMYEQWSLQEVFAILGCCNKTTVHLDVCDTPVQQSRPKIRQNTAATLKECEAQSEGLQSTYLALEASWSVASGASDPMNCSTSQVLRVDLLFMVRTEPYLELLLDVNCKSSCRWERASSVLVTKAFTQTLAHCGNPIRADNLRYTISPLPTLSAMYRVHREQRA